MAFTPRRRASQLTFAVLLAVIATLLSGLAIAGAADCEISVQYSPLGFIESPVHYAEPLHIVGLVKGGGGFEAEFDASNNTFYQRLTGSLNDLGDILTLVPTSDESLAPVCVDDEVYVAAYDTAPAFSLWWGWRKEGGEWFLVETSVDKRAKFKIVTAPVPCEIKYFCYVLQSCPDSSCNTLTPYPEGGVVYVKLGDASLVTELRIIFRQVPGGISLPTDA